MVLWNCVPGDWRDPEGWMTTALQQCKSKAWSLIVLHDQPKGALPHLDTFLTALKEADMLIVQGFPNDCVPIREGRIVGPIEASTSTRTD